VAAKFMTAALSLCLSSDRIEALDETQIINEPEANSDQRLF
jgi:hypothetical protein